MNDMYKDKPRFVAGLIVSELLYLGRVDIHINRLNEIRNQLDFQTYLAECLARLSLQNKQRLGGVIRTISTTKYWKDYRGYLLMGLSSLDVDELVDQWERVFESEEYVDYDDDLEMIELKKLITRQIQQMKRYG